MVKFVRMNILLDITIMANSDDISHEDLVKRLQEIEKFLSGMNHEIMNPLNGILGFSKLLSSDLYSAENKANFVEMINMNANVLQHVVGDVVTLLRIDAGKVKPEPLKFNVRDALKSVWDKKKFTMNKSLSINIAENLPDFDVVTDFNLFSEIVGNLVDNAKKFTPKGVVEIGFLVEGETQIKVFVKDNGIGIPEDRQSEIFDRFVQLDKYSEGSGVGLSVSQAMAKLISTEVKVDSEPEKGSTFYFVLPSAE